MAGGSPCSASVAVTDARAGIDDILTACRTDGEISYVYVCVEVQVHCSRKKGMDDKSTEGTVDS